MGRFRTLIWIRLERAWARFFIIRRHCFLLDWAWAKIFEPIKLRFGPYSTVPPNLVLSLFKLLIQDNSSDCQFCHNFLLIISRDFYDTYVNKMLDSQ